MVRYRNARVSIRDAGLLQIGEKCPEAVEVLRAVGIELVIVTLRASHRGSHPHRGDVAHTVGDVLRLILFGLRATFFRRLQELVVATRDFLLQCRVF